MKQYKKPNIEIIKVDPEKIISTSLPISDETTTDNLKSERRRSSVWDEYENY